MPFANIQGHVNGARLQWARDSHVQMVVAPFIEGMPEEDVIKAETTHWIEFDRYSINQLIRNLRTARDSAFGKDE